MLGRQQCITTPPLPSLPCPAAAAPAPAAASADPFLFIGVLSGRDFRERRDAVREAYAFAAQRRPDVTVRFVLSAAEASAEVAAEQQEHGDLIFAPENATDYRDILAKTLHVS